MSVQPGQSLLHYRIVEKIGEGGMGVVWKAVDTTLDREVAIKILPEVFSADADRLARFEREAKVLASLNHPNIASIHGLHEAGRVRFLAMEFVVGESLARRLARGAVPLEESLRLAGQIAEALEAAHENDVVHRDIKPANIQVTPDGKVKVLDFGLAKLPEAARSSEDPSLSPTLTSAGTVAGMILGTAAYMSPEQARGRPVDKRTDIWSFGCVLYELLTRQQVFPGETVSDVLAGVLAREPDWKRLPSTTSRGIRSLVRRCLRKDARERLHDIADARIEISDALDPDTATLDRTTSEARSPARMAVGVLAGLVIGAVVTGLALWKLTRTEPHEHSTRRLSIPVPEDVQVPLMEREVLALSPDGQTLVYLGYQDGYQYIFRRELNDFRTVPIPGTKGAWGPTISPDGRWVAFLAGGSLKKVAINGGPVTTVGEASGWCGPGWWPDDTIVFESRNQGLFRVPSTGGAPQQTTALDFDQGELMHCDPRILPGGGAMLFTILTEGTARVAVQSLISGERHVLTEGHAANLTSSGRLLFLLGDDLRAAPFDMVTLKTTGESVLLLPDVEHYTLAHDDTLIYSRGSDQDLVLVDHDGQVTKLIESGASFHHPRISPDGSRVAVTTESFEVWVYDILRGTKSRLAVSADDPLWSPASDEIVYASHSEGVHIRSRSADGSGEPRTLISRGQDDFPKAWTSDGAVIVFSTGDGGIVDISLVGLGGDAITELLSGPEDEREPVLSSDNRWIAYVSDESGRDEVYVQLFPALGSKLPISVDGGTEPLWSPDGKTIFYRHGPRVMAVDVEMGQVLSAGVPRVQFEGTYITERGRNYDVTPDGQQFVMIRRAEGWPVEFYVVIDWLEELERLLASDR
jgi:serine/threonine protein kinase/Tol biopolymer transport system component